MRSEPTSKVCPGFCWVPRCADVGIDRPASSVQLGPIPWKRSWVFWREVCSCWSRWRAPAWAPVSSRNPSTPGTLRLWCTRGTFPLRPLSCSLDPGGDGCRTAGCSQCPNRTRTGTEIQRSPQTCWGSERQSDTSPVLLSSSGRGRGDSCEKIKEQLLAVKKREEEILLSKSKCCAQRLQWQPVWAHSLTGEVESLQEKWKKRKKPKTKVVDAPSTFHNFAHKKAKSQVIAL